jgi:hypothetical protein
VHQRFGDRATTSRAPRPFASARPRSTHRLQRIATLDHHGHVDAHHRGRISDPSRNSSCVYTTNRSRSNSMTWIGQSPSTSRSAAAGTCQVLPHSHAQYAPASELIDGPSRQPLQASAQAEITVGERPPLVRGSRGPG